MKLRHSLSIAVAAFFVWISGPAAAQQQFDAGGKARVSNYCKTTVPGDTACTPTGTQTTPDVVTGAAIAAVAGTQTALAIASATAPTVPATATILLIQPQGTNNTSGVCLYWRDDGTNPTASAGQQMAAGATMYYKVTSQPIKFIAATGGTCAVTISYFK